MRMGEAVISAMEIEKENKEEEKKDGSSEVVSWEKFMPKIALKVLLVEADDSTRHIISALLRKCSYKVVAVPDGLMAWETLKGQPQNIDLVLTEVDLPSISGFALLTLIMEHDICKNIPVIMMSSQDSISMVLKCMLKGAADFLIKPVRRNELRNLWQHVWRRQSLLSGHVPQLSPVLQQKSEAMSEDNAESNYSSDNTASKQKNNHSSEKGSDVQSSCTSPYFEAESACMPNMQGFSQKCRSALNLSDIETEGQEECVNLDKKSVKSESNFEEKWNKKGLEVVRSSNAYTSTTSRLEKDSVRLKTSPEGDSGRPDRESGDAELGSGINRCNDESIEPTSQAIDLIGTFSDHPNSTVELCDVNDAMNKFENYPQLELSLRKFFPCSSNDQGTEERHTLNHSSASAFSRYDNSRTSRSSLSKSTELKDGSSKSSELMHNQYENAAHNVQPCSTATYMTEDLASPTINQTEKADVTFANPQPRLSPISGVRFDSIGAGYTPTFTPMFYTQSGVPSGWSAKSSSQQEQSCTSVHSNPEIHDSEQDYRQGDRTTDNSVEQIQCEQKDIEALEEKRQGSSAVGQSTCSSLLNGLGNNDNSGNSGVLCSRVDENVTSCEAINKGTTSDRMNGGTLFIHDSLRGTDSRTSQREAALIKFRLKRKDRCFEKKVRYQSRKNLAEQRPRVKGQFVRQVRNDSTTVPNGAGS